MAGVKLATAYFELIPSMAGSQAAITQQMGAAGAASSKSFSSKFTPGLKGLAAGAAGAFAVKFVKDSVSAASDLGESINAVKVSYGQASKGILALGKNSATSFGLSQSAVNDFAVRFSGFSKQIAGPNGDVAASFEKVLGRATDFASVMNLDVGQAAELFQSGLAGETEPLRKFGIDMSAAATESFAYANGIAKAGTKLTEGQKVQARYGLLMKQTAKTQGDFKNTSGGLANQHRILGATFEKLKVAIGNALIPVLNRLVPIFTKFITFITTHKSAMIALGVIFGVILVAALVAATVAVWSFTVALLANPIVWIIIAIIALVVAIVLLVKHWDLVKAKMIAVWNAIKAATAKAWNAIKAKFADAWTSIKSGVTSVKTWITDKWNAILDFFRGLPNKIKTAASGMWDGIKDAFRAALNWLIGKWNGLKFGIPDFTAFGKHINGFSIGTPQIPLLAQGGIVTRPTLAMIGDAGAEAVIPLNRLDQFGGGRGREFVLKSGALDIRNGKAYINGIISEQTFALGVAQ